VVEEVAKQQSAHHDATQGVTASEAANTVDQLSNTMSNHHAAVHQAVTSNSQGLADYVSHISRQVEDLKRMIPVQGDPIIDQMKILENSLNDLSSQMTTTTLSPIQHELKALSDGLNGVRDAMLKGATPAITTTVAPPAADPDAITQHLSSLKKSLEVAGASQHMQALKNALSPVAYVSAQPPQQIPVPAQQAVAAPVHLVAPAVPVQQPAPAAIVVAPQSLSVDPVTQHLMAFKNLVPAAAQQQVQQAPVVETPNVQAIPVAAKRAFTPAQFHEKLGALTGLLPSGGK